MNPLSVQKLILEELHRDSFGEDVTAQLLGESGLKTAQASIISKAEGVFSGEFILQGFQLLFKDQLDFNWKLQEGCELAPHQIALELSGPARSILSLERTLLNLLGLSCGVATLTRKFVNAVRPFPTTILATRKTLPGLRDLQLQAVVAGGGKIHRRSLSDGILIKENHCEIENPVTLLNRAHLNRSPLHGIEIEVQNFEALDRVLESEHSPDIIMIDNFSPEEASRAVSKIRKTSPRIRIEASGGMSLKTVNQFAEAGVDYISVGQLTHSAPVFDFSLDFKK